MDCQRITAAIGSTWFSFLRNTSPYHPRSNQRAGVLRRVRILPERPYCKPFILAKKYSSALLHSYLIYPISPVVLTLFIFPHLNFFMKQFYPLVFFGAALSLSACKDPDYVVDSYATMRYDALSLPTAADTLALKTVDFLSAREGFVGGAGGTFFATTDAGATWTRRSLASLGTINKLLFSTATTGWAGTSTGLYRTANAGQTWTRVNTYDVYGYTTAGINDVQFVTAQLGYAVGDGGIINKTTNGGTNWTSVQNRTDKRYSFRAVSFSSADSGTVVGHQQSRWLTTNGGQTWTMFDSYGGGISSDAYGFDVLRFNEKSYLLATPSGFQSYTPASLGYYDRDDENYAYPVYGLAAATPKGPVVAVGQRTIVRRDPTYSKREGTPWVYVHLPDGTSPTATYYAADFADAATVYAVGARGTIHRFHYQ
jgi:hypothetical protein